MDVSEIWLASMMEALRAAEDALDTALTEHIYSAADGEKPEPDCCYTAALAKVRAVLTTQRAAEREPPRLTIRDRLLGLSEKPTLVRTAGGRVMTLTEWLDDWGWPPFAPALMRQLREEGWAGGGDIERIELVKEEGAANA